METVEREPIVRGGRAVGVGIGLALLGVLVGAVMGLVGTGLLRVGGLGLGLAGGTVVATVLTELGGYGVVASAFVVRYGWPWPETGGVLRWPTRRELGWITVGIVGLFGGQTGGGLLLQRLGVGRRRTCSSS